MTAAELGLITGAGTLAVAVLTWIVTTRNAERSFTANEEQAWAARLQAEIAYLSGQLAQCRAEGGGLRQQLEIAWSEIRSLREQLATALRNRGEPQIEE